MAIYCNTLEGNMQYSDDPYCFTPNIYFCSYILIRILLNDPCCGLRSAISLIATQLRGKNNKAVVHVLTNYSQEHNC